MIISKWKTAGCVLSAVLSASICLSADLTAHRKAFSNFLKEAINQYEDAGGYMPRKVVETVIKRRYDQPPRRFGDYPRAVRRQTNTNMPAESIDTTAEDGVKLTTVELSPDAGSLAIEMHYRSVRFDEPAEDGVKDFTIVKLPPDAGSLAIEMHYRSVASLQRSLRFDPDEDLRVATGVIYLHTQPLANPLTPEEIANLNRLLVGTPLPYFRNHRVLGLFQRKLDGIPRGGWTFAYGPYSPDSGDKGEYGSVNCWEFMVCARPNLNPIRAKLDPPTTTQSGIPQDPNALCYALRDITCYLCGEKIGIVKEIDQLTCVIACWKRDRPEWYFVKCSNHRLLRALPDIARDAVHTPGWNLSGGAAYTHRSYR